MSQIIQAPEVPAETIDVAGSPVALRRSGTGDPLLFLHGAGFTGKWLRFHQALAEGADVIARSAESVAEKLAIYTEELGAGIHVGASMQVGDMPNWKVVKNMTLFAEQVMPEFRPPGNLPAWARGEPVPGANGTRARVAAVD